MNQDYTSAYYGMGLLYKDGLGVPKDPKEAMRLFRLASNKGDRRAPYEVGLMYEKGVGVDVDKAEALKWYRLAMRREFFAAREKVKALGGEIANNNS